MSCSSDIFVVVEATPDELRRARKPPLLRVLCEGRHLPMAALVGIHAMETLRVLEVFDMLLDRTAGDAKCEK